MTGGNQILLVCIAYCCYVTKQKGSCLAIFWAYLKARGKIIMALEILQCLAPNLSTTKDENRLWYNSWAEVKWNAVHTFRR